MSVLIKPIITEKMTADGELNNRYGFIVNPKANKIQSKEVPWKLLMGFHKIRTMNYGPTRKSGDCKNWSSTW